MFPTLETERLILREITYDDAEGIFACFSNDNVTRFYGQDSLETIDQAKGFVDFFAKNFEEKKGIRWGIERKGRKRVDWDNWIKRVVSKTQTCRNRL